MKTLERQLLLPLDAIGALELGKKPEAVRIVRQQLGVELPAPLGPMTETNSPS